MRAESTALPTTMHRRRPLVLVLPAVLLAASCSAGTPSTTGPPGSLPGSSGESVASTAAPGPDVEVVSDDASPLPEHLAHLADAWPTDWARRTIDLGELVPGLGGPDPRDLIPPIDTPVFERVPVVEWLDEHEPGVVVVVGEDARFYPLSVLVRHEIVNDRVSGVPVAVTYCPLCNTAVVFDRRIDGEVVRLGVSGLLRNSDLVMWDAGTTSLWQQVTGEAVVGFHAGRQLVMLGSRIMSYGVFATSNPRGLALGPDQGMGPVYGPNPYVGYTSRTAPYPMFAEVEDDRLPSLERVVGVDEGGEVRGYPFSVLREERVVNDVVGGVPVVVVWGAPETADPLDAASVPAGDGVGTGVAYRSTVDGTPLTFEPGGGVGVFTDTETGSEWNLSGEAISGPLEGAHLDVALHRNEFFFAFVAFFPDADLHGIPSP